jgi:hypothetical protein
VLRQEQNYAKAARTAKLSPERLRKYAIERGLIEKHGRRWQTRADLPRRMLIFSIGKSLAVTVADFPSASLVGRYMAAVRRFLETNDPTFLASFVGQSVRDTRAKSIRWRRDRTSSIGSRPPASTLLNRFTGSSFNQDKCNG